MNKISYIIVIVIGLGLLSCTNSNKKEEKPSDEKVENNKICDEFLTEYEELVDEYLDVMDTYFKDPGDEANALRYMELMQEAMEWNSRWSELMECADDEKYKKRFEEISNEVEEKINKLQL